MFFLLACTTEAPRPALGSPVEMSSAADGVAAADLDGDGVDELFYVDEGVLRWGTSSHALEGSFQRAAAGDLDGDGREELVVATGMSREYRGPALLQVVSSEGVELLARFQSERTQVPELRVIDGRVWAATYLDSKVVQAGWVEDGALNVQGGGHLATRSLPVGDEVLLSHVYGIEPKSDGDLRIGDRVLPSLRGARSLAAADLDGDGDLEILAGDGWHYAYGAQADGRVTLLDGKDWSESRAIAHFPEDYSASEIEVLDEGWILVTGNTRVHLLSLDDLGWRDDVVAEVRETGNAVAVRTPKGPAVLISGSPAILVPLR